MNKHSLLDIQERWKSLGQNKSPEDLRFEITVYKKLINLFQISDSYFFIFTPPLGKIENISNTLTPILGYEKEEFTVEMFLNIIHPDDFENFIQFEKEIINFKLQLSPDKIMKYKSRYNYRIRKKNGEYIPILHQSLTIECDDTGAVIRNLIVHSDLSDYSNEQSMQLSFIGLEEEPSFKNIKTLYPKNFTKPPLTSREKEIMHLLFLNKNTTEISKLLYISKYTVQTHRKNILKKTNTHNTFELLQLAQKEGWV